MSKQHDLPDLIAGMLGVSRGTAYDMMREALAEQPAQQEPFGYFFYDLRLDAWVQNRAGPTGTPFYTSPQPSKPLTDEEINAFFDGMEPNNGFWLSFARAIEAAHGIKENT